MSGVAVKHRCEVAADRIAATIAEEQSTMTVDEWRYLVVLLRERVLRMDEVEKRNMENERAAAEFCAPGDEGDGAANQHTTATEANR